MTRAHLYPLKFDQITIAERRFPFRMRADLQRTIDELFGDEILVHKFVGVHHSDFVRRKHFTSIRPRHSGYLQ